MLYLPLFFTALITRILAVFRYYTCYHQFCSLINLEETLDQDLDAILGELNALENNFGDGDPDISRDSDTSSKASKASSTISSSSTVVQVIRPSTAGNPLSNGPFSPIPENNSIAQHGKSPKSSLPGKELSKMQF